MIAKFPGHCPKCNGDIKRGELINFYGRGHAEHAHCGASAEMSIAGPCWICKDPAGYFRNLGAATPVWCDKCFAAEKEKTQTVANIRFTRFSSGATVYRNALGRCEDAPCCGCCS